MIGGTLSWLTITNDQAASMARAVFGPPRPEASLVRVKPPAATDLGEEGFAAATPRPALADQPADPRDRDAASIPNTVSSDDPQRRLGEISAQLRQLGASYLLLEKLPHPDRPRYRARCDLAGEHTTLKCCFEATRGSAVAALEEVLKAVRSMGKSSPSQSRSTLATSI